MSDSEALMWRLEHDPRLSSTFGNLTILEGRLDVERLRRRLAHAALVVPRLRQRVVQAPGGFGPPRWVEDVEFDLDRHVRHISLPSRSSMQALYDLASMLTADPLDRHRPLWQFVVIDGLPRGRSALLEKLHHTIADGEAALALAMHFMDLAADRA
ncbi:MAG: wax ester/triacylglycerol synthase family O-acyltransferase [Ilumatobacteraceae bacterium]